MASKASKTLALVLHAQMVQPISIPRKDYDVDTAEQVISTSVPAHIS